MKKRTILVHLTTLHPDDHYVGEKMKCFACDAEHRANAAAIVEDGTLGPDDAFAVPICNGCARIKDTTNVVLRKYLGAPELSIGEPGVLSDELFDALMESDKHSHH